MMTGLYSLYVALSSTSGNRGCDILTKVLLAFEIGSVATQNRGIHSSTSSLDRPDKVVL